MSEEGQPLSGAQSATGQPERSDGWAYCSYCGEQIAFTAPVCPKCGAPQKRAAPGASDEPVSPKGYGAAVSLCGVFGMMGIHHFYLGNILHGLLDLGMFLGWVLLLFGPAEHNEGLMALAILLLIADALHTFWVFIKLICGNARDSNGLRVAVPQ